MAKGELGLPSKPLQMEGEQWNLEERTTDPASTQKGEAWLRTDLAPESNQLATLRFDNGSGFWDIPIFQTGTSGPDVEEVLRIPVGSTTGYIPILANAPTFPQLGFQHASTRYGLHDRVNALPGSAIHRWLFDEGSGTSVNDDIGTADGTINGSIAWVSGSWVGGSALDSPGALGDYIETTTWGSFGSGMATDLAVAFTVQSSAFNADRILGTVNDGTATVFSIGTGVDTAGDIDAFIRDENGTGIRSRTGGGFDDGAKHRVVLNKEGNDGADVSWHVDGVDETVTTSGTGLSNPANFQYPVPLFAWNNRGAIETNIDAILDDVIVFDDSLTSQQIQDDYDRQPWSP